MKQASIFNKVAFEGLEQVESECGNWKVVYFNDSKTTRIEKGGEGKREFEILLTKVELSQLSAFLSKNFNK